MKHGSPSAEILAKKGREKTVCLPNYENDVSHQYLQYSDNKSPYYGEFIETDIHICIGKQGF